jgi:hypothetical protein
MHPFVQPCYMTQCHMTCSLEVHFRRYTPLQCNMPLTDPGMVDRAHSKLPQALSLQHCLYTRVFH